MSPLTITLSIIQIIAALVIIVIIMFQDSNQKGLSGSIAGGAETFFGKNKGRTIEAKLKKWTIIVSALFIILTVAISVAANLG